MGEFERKMKEKIGKELKKVKREIVTIREEELSEQQGGGDNTPLSEAADVAQLLEGVEIRNERQGWLFRRARALEEALQRVEQGSYGVCTNCGEPIAPKRLDAIPEALLCTACQTLMETEEKAVRRPQEPGSREWGEGKDVIERDDDVGG